MTDRVCGCRDAPNCVHKSVPEQRLAEAIWPADEPSAEVRGDDEHSVWCRAELSPFGAYMLVIDYDTDNSLSLNRDQLLEYVGALSEALMRAQYAEGVRRQIADIIGRSKLPSPGGEPPDVVALRLVAALREEWPPLPTFAPYRLMPIVSAEGRTSVQVWRGKQVIVQLAPHNVHEHVVHALRVYAAADLDASYRRHLLSMGLDAGRASAAIDDLSNYLREE